MMDPKQDRLISTLLSDCPDPDLLVKRAVYLLAERLLPVLRASSPEKGEALEAMLLANARARWIHPRHRKTIVEWIPEYCEPFSREEQLRSVTLPSDLKPEGMAFVFVLGGIASALKALHQGGDQRAQTLAFVLVGLSNLQVLDMEATLNFVPQIAPLAIDVYTKATPNPEFPTVNICITDLLQMTPELDTEHTTVSIRHARRWPGRLEYGFFASVRSIYGGSYSSGDFRPGRHAEAYRLAWEDGRRIALAMEAEMEQGRKTT